MDIASLIELDGVLTQIAVTIRQEPFELGVPEVDEQLANYQDEITALSLQAANGDIEQEDFERQLEEIVFAAMLLLFLLGAETDAVPWEANNDYEQERYIALRAVAQLSNDIYTGRYGEIEQDDEITQTAEEGAAKLENRLRLWAATAAGVYALGQLYLGAATRLQWRLGMTDQHCTDCARLNNQVHTAQQWRLSGYRPQGRNLECGGWNCDCRLEKTEAAEQGGF